MWYLRKFYAGNGGCLPPTDPRILAMTPEQIDLEFEHILLDRANSNENKEVYVDSDYDDYDKESEEVDRRLSDTPAIYRKASNELPKEEIIDEEDWEVID